MKDEDKVEFDEKDEDLAGPTKSEVKVPDKGLEGFLYKFIPGGYSSKKLILIIVTVFIFITALGYFALGLYNLTTNL